MGKRLDLGAEPPRKTFFSTPGERPLLSNKVTTRRFEQKKYSGIFIDFSYNYFNHNVKPLSQIKSGLNILPAIGRVKEKN